MSVIEFFTNYWDWYLLGMIVFAGNILRKQGLKSYYRSWRNFRNYNLVFLIWPFWLLWLK